MKKILVIEDNFDIRENICETLELSGYKTFQAPNGKSGIEAALNIYPDLIICDIMMPEMDGYEVLSILSKDVKTTGIPFIFLTAKAEKADFRKGLSLGADDYITKPFREDELLNAVQLRLQKIDYFKQLIEQTIAQTATVTNTHADFNELLSLDKKEVKKFKKKEFVYLEGHRAAHLFYVQKGSVKTFKLHEEGKELITDIYNEGSFFGYYPLLTDTLYQDYAECLEKTELILIPKADFTQLIYNNIDIARQFIKRLTNDIVEKENQLLHMAYDTLRQRVIRTLKDLYYKFKDESSDEVRIRLTREEISKFIGTARESFIRIMSELKDSGLIEIIDGDIVITNIQKIESLT